MGVIIDHDLSAADVSFLLTVRDILNNTKDYDNTDPGETPANVTVIRNETDLTKTQVAYRCRDGDDSRGFGESGKGWLRTHGPSIEGKRFGPRSVELTDEGYRIVDEIEQSQSPNSGEAAPANGVSGEEIARVNEELSELKEAVENMSDEIAAMKQDRTGALEDDFGAKLEAIARAFPQQNFILTEVFGVDMSEVANIDPDDEASIRQLREKTYQNLTEDLEGVEAASNNPPE